MFASSPIESGYSRILEINYFAIMIKVSHLTSLIAARIRRVQLSKSLVLIFILALLVRLIYFRGALTFFYDQARDALMAMEIFRGDPIKIIGPSSDFPGLHHGPLYWYLIGPIYYFTQGNVLIVRFFLIILNLLTIFFIYDLGKLMFKNKKVAVLAIFLFAISFEATQYARWLSNPAPALLTITISFWALYRLIRGEAWALIPLFISSAASIQLQLFLIYQIMVFIIIWVSLMGFKLPRASFKIYLLSFLGFLATISTYIVSELKFNFQGARALFEFFKTQTLFTESFVGMFESYLDRVVKVFFLNLWGINLFLAGLVSLLTIYLSVLFIKRNRYKKEIFLLIIWILSPIIINFFTGPNANYITLGTLVPSIILTAFLLFELRRTQKIIFSLAIAIIIFGNLNLILTKNKEGEVLFSVQKTMILGDELKVIDWVYHEASGKPFKLNTVTSPLFINTTWAHLFSWYGRSKYKYMPIWWGETQTDLPGAKIKFADNTQTDLHFLIIEPTSTGDDNFIKAIKFLENERSEVLKKEEIGSFKVEKRKIKNQKTFTSADVFHLIKNTDLRDLQNVE